MSKDISLEKNKLRLLWKEKRKKLSLNFSNEYKKYFIKNFFLAQNEISNFIDKCKRMESKDGFIKETSFNIYLNKSYKFISGALSGTLFKILELNKKEMNILIGSTKVKMNRKKNYLFNPA